MFLGLPDPAPLVRGTDPDPSISPEPDPAPLVRGRDPGIRIRIRIKMSGIPNTAEKIKILNGKLFDIKF